MHQALTFVCLTFVMYNTIAFILILTLLLHQSFKICNLHLLSIDKTVSLGPGLVPVARVLDHVEPGELGLPVVVELLLLPRHRLPPGAQDLGDVGVVEIGTRVQDLPPLVLGPDHEGVHWPLYVIFLAPRSCLFPLRMLPGVSMSKIGSDRTLCVRVIQ